MTNRMCSITRKIFPTSQLFRIVRTPDKKILFDRDLNILGRGIYVSKNIRITEKFFDSKKRGMIAHMLKIQISRDTMIRIEKEVRKEVEKFLEKKI